MSDALRRVLASVFPAEEDRAVRRIVEEAGAPPELGPAAAAQLRSTLPERPDDESVAAFVARAPGDRLLLAYLKRAINRDPALERWLVRARARLLTEWAGRDGVRRAGARDEALIAALALQCFHNEYVWCTDEEEERLLAEALARLERDLAGGVDPGSDALTADLLAVLGAVKDPISRSVQAQYEENPYPRWLSLPEGPAAELGEALARRFPHPRRGAPLRSILVAGGGTGFEPLLAARQSPDARIVSLDLSRASLAYGAREAGRLGLNNVRFVQGDLLDAADLGERFDLVLASGVLHHMDDPVAGLGALAGVLEPHGLMKIGLYSEYARDLVTRARKRSEDAGLDGTTDGIRRFRGELMDGRWPELAELLASEDFYGVSTCRDLVFHVHERRFTIPGVAAALAACGLRPLDFDTGAGVRRRFRERFPEDPDERSLEKWAAFESEHRDAFAGMYLLWVERGSGTEEGSTLRGTSAAAPRSEHERQEQ